MTSENYYHKLIVGKDAFVDIKIEEKSSGIPKISALGNSRIKNFYSSWVDSLKEVFEENPEDLYIPKEDFDCLMVIVKRCQGRKYPVLDNIVIPHGKSVDDFLKSLKSSPENQKIEDKLQESLLSEDPFSVVICGKTISFESENQSGFGIKYQIDDNDRLDEKSIIGHFKRHSGMSIKGKGNSLTRKEILSAFVGHIDDATKAECQFEEFAEEFGNDYTWYEECKDVESQLWDLRDIDNLNDTLILGEKTNYTFWEFEEFEGFEKKKESSP